MTTCDPDKAYELRKKVMATNPLKDPKGFDSLFAQLAKEDGRCLADPDHRWNGDRWVHVPRETDERDTTIGGSDGDGDRQGA